MDMHRRRKVMKSGEQSQVRKGLRAMRAMMMMMTSSSRGSGENSRKRNHDFSSDDNTASHCYHACQISWSQAKTCR